MPTQEWKDKIEKLMNRISESDTILESNKKLLKRFKRELKLKEYSDARTHKLLNHMVLITENFPHLDLEGASKEDIEDVVEWVQDKDYSAETKKDYRVALRVFYKWLDMGSVKSKKPSERVEDLSATAGKQSDKLPEQMFTEDEINELITNATNIRTKCLIAMLWETGGRIGEIIDLKAKDLQKWRHGYHVYLKGKTGSRRVPLIISEPYINQWLDRHPMKNSQKWPDEWLWVDVKHQDHGKKKRVGDKADYNALVRDIQRTAKKAKITKPVNPHNFRHSRATFIANHFTEARLSTFFGWKPGSKMIERYVHLSSRDLDDPYAELHGIEAEDTSKPQFLPKRCMRCHEQKISPDSKFCPKCGAPLDPETVAELEDAESKLMTEFAKLGDTEVMKMLETTTKLYQLAQNDPEVAKKLKEQQ